MEVEADPVYQTVLVQVERILWRCVQTGEPPKLFGVEPPKAKVAAVKVVDMSRCELGDRLTARAHAGLPHWR
jgi:hypothetical protein